MRRQLLLIVLAATAGMVVLVLTVPFWFGAAVKLAAPSFGLDFGAYERIGYSRFALRDVEYRRPGLRVTASRAEAETPLLWWWHHWRGTPDVITAGDWRVEVAQRESSGPPAPDRGWMQLRGLLQRIAGHLDQWLPRASTGAGVVQWPGGEISLAAARWAGRELEADDVTFRSLKVDATITFAGEDRLRVSARMDNGLAALKLESRGADVSGEFAVWEQPASVDARFAPSGWMPVEAKFNAANWNVSGEHLKLGQAYAAVRGGARVEWREERVFADIKAAGEPLPGKTAPPLQLAVRGNGDLQAFTLETLTASLPGIEAQLSAPVVVERSGRFREGNAEFSLAAELEKVPWFSASGKVNGQARIVSGVSAAPVVEFSLMANDVSARDVALSAVDARGRLEWPRLQILDGSIAGGEGERLTWKGGWDFRAREVLEAAVNGQIRRQSLARWLPSQPEFDIVKLSVGARGPIATLEHEGTLEAAAVKVTRINPVDVKADWRGKGAALDAFNVTATAGSSALAASGMLDRTSLRLNTLDLRQGESPRLQLAAPAVVRWRPRLEIESLRLAGPEGSLDALATAGESGQVKIAIRNVSGKWFSDWIPMPGPPWNVSLLALVGTWDKGPMVFSLTAGASLELGEGRTAAVNIASRGDKDGVRIEALRATESDATVVNATGRLPVTFSPGGGPPMRIEPDGPLLLNAAVEPNSAFWQKLAAISGVDLKDPSASAQLTGTWRQPEGKAALRAARIAIDPKRIARPLPTMEALDVALTGDHSGVTLQTFAVRIEGQTVRAQGRLPVPDGHWKDLFKDPLGAARSSADVRIEVPDAEVAVFARFLPAVLAPKGRLQADVHYQGGDLQGFLRLRDAASRPLGPLGVLQEISADVAMAGRKFALAGVTAKSGGQPVTLNGTVELPAAGPPIFNLSLRGENLPFVRQTGLLLRGDLDLKLQTPDGGQPRLSGTVRLRDSLFLADVRAFLPKGGASAAKRPPYFAIETPPVNAWTLAIDLEGERFLRLRTPVFSGVASARFRLGGTLGEPRAIGEVEVDEGAIQMPFASFNVTQGSVRLTEADPFEPTIYVRGTDRRYGYDVIMEIDGTASQPNVVFTSSPPLDSEQVLLMVMTGAAPNNEIAKTGTQRAANIGLFLGKSLLGSLGTDPGDVSRLTFESGERISRQGKETYDIEYRLSDRLTLTGEYNEFDEYNAGVKWRMFGGKPSEETSENAKK